MLDQRSLWQSVVGEIELLVPKTSFNTFFKPSILLSVNGSNIKIGVPNVFVQTQLNGRYKQILIDTFSKNNIKNPNIIVEVNFKSKIKPVSREVISNTDNKSSIMTGNLSTITRDIERRNNTQNKTGLNSRYTFDNFIVGSSNDFAYNACQAVADNPGSKYNPLFIYSGVGLGKTHLVQAVGNEIVKQNNKLTVLYTTIENFTNEFVRYIRFKDRDFAKKYRNVDVLIVDDMQFIANKEKIQEEFFHTFNTLHQANKQIIITSDRPPREIPTLTERLRSRFEWGMTIDIQMPDFETRCAILEAKAAQVNIELDKLTVEYLANNFRTNIRELEGALNQLLAFAEMRGIEPTLETAEGLVDGSRASRPKHLTANQVVVKTAAFYQTTPEILKSPSRTKEVVLPRQIAMYLLRSELHMSFPKISNELGRKDHTTAIYGVEKIEKEYKLNTSVREHINSIRESLYQ